MKFAPILLSGLVYSLIASASITICGAATVDEITLYNKRTGKKFSSTARARKARSRGTRR